MKPLSLPSITRAAARTVAAMLMATVSAAQAAPDSGVTPPVAVAVAVAGIYPQFGQGAVGDPMPLSVDGQIHFFYLYDGPTGGVSFHPWHHAWTDDLVHYMDGGEALPVVEDVQSRELALGTGSVIKAGDVYHAYYTGFNKRLDPFEAILHATSPDLVHWTKHPEDTFQAPAGYERNDFRDPHVIRVPGKDEYWMLVTARTRGRGVIAKLVSKDLVHWADGGVLFVNDLLTRDANLECPTLFRIGDFWYLTFSDQWPTRRTQYRVSRRIDGPFERPRHAALDGAGLYAGKVVEHEGHRYLAGWVPRKTLLKDSGDFTWGGNLVVHQLEQDADGTLTVHAPGQVLQLFDGTRATQARFDKIALPAAPHAVHELGRFGDAPGTVYRISGTFERQAGSTGTFGFEFGVKPSGGRINLVMDAADRSLKFFNVPMSRAADTKPQAYVDIDLSAKTKFEIVVDASVAVLYVDGRYALTSRMYGLPGGNWQVFSENTALELSDLRVSQVKIN